LLANRVRLDAAEEENPQITAAAIRAPVFITGLPRSATSFLHSLLSLDPGNAVPRCWRLIHPYPPSNALAAFLCKTQVELQLQLFRCLNPGISSLHELSADEPQNAPTSRLTAFRASGLTAPTISLPTRHGWMPMGITMPSVFIAAFSSIWKHRRRAAIGSSSRPDHVFALDTIRNIYPDAKIVFLHRDPLSVAASCSKLTELLRRPFTTGSTGRRSGGRSARG
jgi:hypothetical protein